MVKVSILRKKSLEQMTKRWTEAAIDKLLLTTFVFSQSFTFYKREFDVRRILHVLPISETAVVSDIQ